MQSDLGGNKLSLMTRIAYGIGDFGPSMAGNTLMVFFFFFLTTIAGLSPDLAGIILCLSQGWSAISTLLIGALSDRTRSRWGRRRSWMLGSAPILAISFFLHWWVPPWQTGLQFCYFLIVALLFQAAGNAFTIPYGALLNEISDQHDEHIRLNGFRFSFSLSGCILSLLLAQVISHWVNQPQQQVFDLGIVCAIAIAVSILCCCWGTKERTNVLDTPSKAVQLEWKSLLNNRCLVLLAGIYAFSWLALQITPAVLPYFIVHCLQLESSAIPKIVLFIQGTALITLPVWAFLSRSIGKKVCFWAGTSLWVLAAVALVDLHAGQMALVYGLSVLIGAGMATTYLIPLSMLPEVADLDEMMTGQRREGLLYSIMVFLQKIALALGLFAVGQLLTWSGFQQTVLGPVQLLQPNSALMMIRSMTAFIPVLSLLASLLLMSLYSTQFSPLWSGEFRPQRVTALKNNFD